MEPAVEASHKAHLAYKNATNHEVLTAPRTDRAVSGAPNPFMKELKCASKELSKAIDCIFPGKDLGSDGNM